MTESVKRAVVHTARDSWEVYFSRLFPATVRALPARPTPPGPRAQDKADVPLSPQGSVGTGVQILAVSHTGIKLLQMARGHREASGQLRVLRAYRCRQRVDTGAEASAFPHCLSTAGH